MDNKIKSTKETKATKELKNKTTQEEKPMKPIDSIYLVPSLTNFVYLPGKQNIYINKSNELTPEFEKEQDPICPSIFHYTDKPVINSHYQTFWHTYDDSKSLIKIMLNFTVTYTPKPTDSVPNPVKDSAVWLQLYDFVDNCLSQLGMYHDKTEIPTIELVHQRLAYIKSVKKAFLFKQERNSKGYFDYTPIYVKRIKTDLDLDADI